MSNVMDVYVNFTKTTHQIWSCHVTRASNFENFYFLLNSVLNFRKVTKFGEIGPRTKTYKQKTTWGWKTSPPVLIGLRVKPGVQNVRYRSLGKPSKHLFLLGTHFWGV